MLKAHSAFEAAFLAPRHAELEALKSAGKSTIPILDEAMKAADKAVYPLRLLLE